MNGGSIRAGELQLPGPFGGQPSQVFDVLPQQPQALIELLALQSRRERRDAQRREANRSDAFVLREIADGCPSSDRLINVADLRINWNEVSERRTCPPCFRESTLVRRSPNGRPLSCDFGHGQDQKRRGLAGNHRLTPVILGSPTWARTRDLRINRTALSEPGRR